VKPGRAILLAIILVAAGAIWWSYQLLRGPDLHYDFRKSHLDRDAGWPTDRNGPYWHISRVRSVSVDLPGVPPINRRDVADIYFDRKGSRLSEMDIFLKPVDRQTVMLQGREIGEDRHWPDPSKSYEAWTRLEKAFGPSSIGGVPNGSNVLEPPPLDVWALICPGGGTPGDSYCIEIIVHWDDH
jgi:hypothetical protein